MKINSSVRRCAISKEWAKLTQGEIISIFKSMHILRVQIFSKFALGLYVIHSIMTFFCRFLFCIFKPAFWWLWGHYSYPTEQFLCSIQPTESNSQTISTSSWQELFFKELNLEKEQNWNITRKHSVNLKKESPNLIRIIISYLCDKFCWAM